MTWRSDGNHEAGSETAKCRFDIVPYMRGKALDLGCGPTRAWPHFVGVDSGKDEALFGVQMRPGIRSEVERLPMLASGEWDCVFSSHTLEHVADYKATLAEWWRLVKVGGYMVLYVPDADEYPQCAAEKREEWEQWFAKYGAKFHNHQDSAAEELANVRRRKGVKKIGEIYAGTHWANPDHLHDFTYDKIVGAMHEVAAGWQLIEFEQRNKANEYSLWFVFQKRGDGLRQESWKYTSKPAKTAAIVRYGAIGDMAMVTSILPRLKEQGFHITLYTGTTGEDLLKHNPHIDRMIVQEKDAVPPQLLGAYWDHERKKYDRWINLSESVEGRFLACPDRIEFWWPNQARKSVMDRNYLEHAHELAQVSGPYRTEFHSTEEERIWAQNTAYSFGRRNVLWSLAGSSGHKTWPHLDAVIAGILYQYEDAHVVLVGDESCQILERGWQKEPRVHCMSGKWNIRKSIAFCEVADLIIGTETGLLNAAGCMKTPKIITLSHSSAEMLTKHWLNVTTLRQPDGIGCPKAWSENGGACRQLHGGSNMGAWIDCPQHEQSGAALCQHHVTPAMMFDAVRSVMGKPVTLEKAA